MNPRFTIILAVILFGIHAQLSASTSDHLNLLMCMRNRTVAVQILAGEDDDMSCKCQAARTRSAAREDYVHTPGIGSHKLHTNAKSWNDARKICIEEGGHLAIINSKTEEEVLLDIFNKRRETIKDGANREEAFLGVHDFFTEGDWVTVLGESLYSTGYAHWSETYWGGQPDNKDNNQNCAALIYLGGMDDCHCHEKFAFFCEMPLNCQR